MVDRNTDLDEVIADLRDTTTLIISCGHLLLATDDLSSEQRHLVRRIADGGGVLSLTIERLAEIREDDSNEHQD